MCGLQKITVCIAYLQVLVVCMLGSRALNTIWLFQIRGRYRKKLGKTAYCFVQWK